MKRFIGLYIVFLCIFLSSISYADQKQYVVKEVINDDVFIINGEKFEAKTYCFGWAKGDKVIFLEGSPNGACISAKIRNLKRKKTCEVWCQ